MSFWTCCKALHMDWLKAMSVVALGMITAILICLTAGAVVGASVAAGACVAAGASVAGAWVGATGAPHAASTTTSMPRVIKFRNFIFILLLERQSVLSLHLQGSLHSS